MTLPLPFKTSRLPDIDVADDATKLAWLRLIRTPSIGPVTFYQLLDAYGTADEALEAIPELARRGGRKTPLTPPPLKDIEREYKRLKKLGGELVLACEKNYPLALGVLDDAPPVLTVKGDITLMARPCFGIVGARNASLNGRKFAAKIASELGKEGQIIVSGLARGIDTAAHEGALETGTIAVVAGGIDVVYPPENQKLYDEICEKGLIIAESPVGQKPFARSFPARNRIVSGLSSGILVVEATKRSGSLITARLAGEQGRDVFAVPGHPYDPRAEGPNHLIRDGATLIRSASDILENLQDFSQAYGFSDSAESFYHEDGTAAAYDEGLAAIAKGKPRFHFDMDNSAQNPHQNKQHGTKAVIAASPDKDKETKQVQGLLLNALSFTPLHIDDLIRSTAIPAAITQTALLELEMAQRVERLPGNHFILARNEETAEGSV